MVPSKSFFIRSRTVYSCTPIGLTLCWPAAQRKRLGNRLTAAAVPAVFRKVRRFRAWKLIKAFPPNAGEVESQIRKNYTRETQGLRLAKTILQRERQNGTAAAP